MDESSTQNFTNRLQLKFTSVTAFKNVIHDSVSEVCSCF
uniref:Uncharacterized protein n=1 Tax=Anguilla anguilla TaxID=7936 RepID=A0A0E9VIH6_ANGAN